MIRYAENDLRLSRSRAILFANQPILGGSELFFDYGELYLSARKFVCKCGTLCCDEVVERWRFANREEVIRTCLAYFDYIEKRMIELDQKAKQYLHDKGIRDKGIHELEHDGLDSGSSPTRRRSIDRSSIHLRRSDNRYVICYNLFCSNANECTCEPVVAANSPGGRRGRVDVMPVAASAISPIPALPGSQQRTPCKMRDKSALNDHIYRFRCMACAALAATAAGCGRHESLHSRQNRSRLSKKGSAKVYNSENHKLQSFPGFYDDLR
ncbi:hypothetical protein KIN20_024424 [Parelaphostrongylus tenuis]|uniref:Uncharacterized protein n=1 Tax=Parelaphostrongylus tenuis TaxID=148309 RepID=A0AAD5N857_PARTN|nr:hypothetical protein KIN20_024424 [Parelaphostrongylus tenuis]